MIRDRKNDVGESDSKGNKVHVFECANFVVDEQVVGRKWAIGDGDIYFGGKNSAMYHFYWWDWQFVFETKWNGSWSDGQNEIGIFKKNGVL